ncbi:MAG TPA: prepilin-type N-terminal cleavage/methylation domain-containing protein [Verrucomicrobiae bacterium]|nr:prepilin-type N-terminal cleavage/methylation domain-containing protein [Verrucomicrobiae bacterium]
MPRTSVKDLGRSGFSLVETLLVIIVVVVIAAAGYLVYHHAHQKKHANASAKTATTKSTGANGGKGGKGGPDTGSAKTEVFLIKEWNVSAAIPTPPENAALIQYKIVNATPSYAEFTTQELIDAAGDACSAGHQPAGHIARAKGNDPYYLDDGTRTGHTVAQEMVSGGHQPYKQVGDYYYWYAHPQAGCGDLDKTNALQTAAIEQVQQIVNHLEQD